MFRKFIICLLISFSLAVFSQTDTEPVVWKTSFVKINETEFDIIFEANIATDWHLYSQYNPDEASLPLAISSVDKNANYQLIGKAKESKTYKEYSDIWEKEEVFFKDKALLTQRIKLTNKEITTIKLNVFGQVCKQVCINFDENFEIQLSENTTKSSTIKLDEKSKILSQKLELDLKNKELLANNSTSKTNSNLLNIFLLGLFGGFLALLTPCVFPMIPLTVSFFTKQNQSKGKGLLQASLYGIFIVLIYVLLSVPFHFLDNINPEILNTISTNIWLNIFFFIIFGCICLFRFLVFVFFMGKFFCFLTQCQYYLP
ncbi:MAG: hypothetical protein HC798_01165 [Polaribacter sp.]|nr:hypothetical protein [Polaribacter sp.]